jgi:hypothetical protein
MNPTDAIATFSEDSLKSLLQSIEPMRESVLTQRFNVPRAKFQAWRKAGQWREGEHFSKDSAGAYVLTDAGAIHMLELLRLKPEEVPVVTTVELLAVCPGAMNRVLRCKSPEGGPMVSVRLTGPRVFAASFRRGDRIQAVPTETEGIYEYDGGVPRRVRI